MDPRSGSSEALAEDPRPHIEVALNAPGSEVAAMALGTLEDVKQD